MDATIFTSANVSRILQLDLSCSTKNIAKVLDGDCRELTIAQHKNLCSLLREKLSPAVDPSTLTISTSPLPVVHSSLTQSTEELNVSSSSQTQLTPTEQSALTLEDEETLWLLKRRVAFLVPTNLCFFFPTASWTSDDCVDWLDLIGFETQGLLQNSVATRLSGKNLADGDLRGVFSQDEWCSIVKKFDEFVSRLDMERILRNNPNPNLPRLSADIYSLSSMNKDASQVKYIPIKYSSDDFVACAKELVDHKYYPPPNHPQTELDDNVLFFAPYTCAIQSTCSGKTRFLLTPIKEDDDVRVMVVYFTMEPNTEYYSDQLLHQIFGFLKNKDIFDSHEDLAAVYQKFLEILFKEDGELKEEYSEKGGIPAEELCESIDPKEEVAFRDSTKLWCISEKKRKRVIVVIALDEAHKLLDDKFSDATKYGLPIIKAEKALHIAKRQRLCDSSVERRKPLIENINMFTLLRRGLRLADRNYVCTIPVILTSTNSRITNFMPHHSFDPSRREDLVGSETSVVEYLHRPFILQETFDIFARTEIEEIVGGYTKYIQSMDFVYNLFLHGRPYWGSLYKAGIKNLQNPMKLVNTILDNAGQKFAVGKMGSLSKTEDIDCLAVLGHTISLEPLATSALASAIVESRMGFLEYVDPVRGFFVASFHPEPVIALVAGRLLMSSAIIKYLDKYRQLTEVGQVDIGSAGEFVVRLSLLIAKNMVPPSADYAQANHQVLKATCPCSLEDLLDTLVSPTVNLDVSTRKSPRIETRRVEFLDGLLSFTNFIKVESLVEEEDNFKLLLEQALVRSSALILPNGNVGVDLALPIVTVSGKLSAVLVQVKNYANPSSVDKGKCIRKMTQFSQLHDLEDPYYLIMIVCNTSARRVPFESDLEKKGRLAIIEGTRFSFKHPSGPAFLDKENMEKLHSLLNNLSDAYRSAKTRLTPKYAHFFKTNFPFFKKQ